MRQNRWALALLGGALAIAACGDEAEPPARPPADAERGADPPTANRALVDSLRADLAAPRHPADGGGRAVLDGPPEPAALVAGGRARFAFTYEAGPLGIAEGGSLVFHPSGFWGWSAPQLARPDAPGYTEIRSDAEGVRLETSAPGDPPLVEVVVRGRALRAGERVRIAYGAGPAAAAVDRFAERGETFTFAVDGDGDGVRAPLAQLPAVDVGPASPARLVVWLPATARPGEEVRLTAALLDRSGNAGAPVAATLRLETEAGLEAPAEIALAPEDAGRRTVAVRVAAEGVYRVRATSDAGLAAESNPIVVRAEAPQLLWGDLHGHSRYSDGTGTPGDWYAYARDVAALDVAALTDHDHWGAPFLDASPERWAAIRAATDAAHEPGRFVTVLGYEWTSWIHGHRHVLYFDGAGEVLSSIDERWDTPAKLWDALRGRPALTFAHHSAGGPIATDWSFAPDPELEPVTEIVSVHGSSEAPDGPAPIRDPVAGNWVRDVVGRGARLGFIGSGDSHDGHPGLPQLIAASGGLAGIWSEERSREGVLAALRARRVYATNGARIWLRVALAGQEMGALVSARALGQARAAGGGGPELTVRVAAPGPVARVEVVHGGGVATSAPGEGRRELSLRWLAPELAAGDSLYVRVVQEDGGAAWSSPFFVEE